MNEACETATRYVEQPLSFTLIATLKLISFCDVQRGS